MFKFLGTLFGLFKSVGLYFMARRSVQAGEYKEIIEDVETAKRVKKNLKNKSASDIARKLRKYRRD